MKHRQVAPMVVGLACVLAGMVLAAQDRFSLKTPNGIVFGEFKDYETWQVIAASQPDDADGCGSSPKPGCIKAIVGNPAMIAAYKEGIPANGKAVPDGAAMAKIEWQKARPKSAYPVTAPGPLSEVSFMLKDSKRFPDTNGWGYATFRYDAATDTWKPFGDRPTFDQTCHGCHTIVKARNFVFTDYPKR